MSWERVFSDSCSEKDLNKSILEADKVEVSVDDSAYSVVNDFSGSWRLMAVYQASEIFSRQEKVFGYDEEIFYLKTDGGDNYSIRCLLE